MFASHFRSHNSAQKWQTIINIQLEQPAIRCLLTIVYHWLSKMTSINIKGISFMLYKLLFQLCMCKNVNSAFEFPIDLIHRSIKIDTIDDTHSLSSRKMKVKKKDRTTISSGHSILTQSFYHIASCLSFVRLISNEWWGKK